MTIFNQKIITTNLRKCQKEAYDAVYHYFTNPKNERSGLIQMPTGTGKSPLIALLPFNLAKKKVLILTPNVKLAKQLEADLDLTKRENKYRQLGLLEPEVLTNLELYVLRLEGSISHNDITEHHILIANYHQLQDIEKWFKDDKDAIDLIIIDEAHHQEAGTYQEITKFFGNAKIIGLTATPFRSDGKKVEGKLIYKYHFHEAINDGIIRNVKVVNVSPNEVSLSFTDNKSKNYTLHEIMDLKEDAWFNLGIALSSDCCFSIAQKAKEKLDDLNAQFPKAAHQIIAVAISKRHAREFVKPSFERLGLKVGMVSSDAQDKKNNDKIFNDLKLGKIQVIVHIGMLGEGFDHPPLGVAAIFRPYKSLNPYIQFLGRVIRKNDDTRYCYVVSHLGLNQIKRFQEFKMFDYEDKKFLEELLSENTSDENSFAPDLENKSDTTDLADDQQTLSIRELGDEIIDFESQFVSGEEKINQLAQSVEQLSPQDRDLLFKKLGLDLTEINMSVGKKNTRVKPADKRKASRGLLNEREKSIVVDILKALALKPYSRDFNPLFINPAWVKRKVSKEVNSLLNIKANQRKSIDNAAFEKIEKDGLLNSVQLNCLNYFTNKLAEKNK